MNDQSPSASLLLAQEAYSLLVAQLTKNGSILNPTTGAALKAVQQHMVRLLTGRPQDDPRYYLASLDPGMGKTEAACSLLQAWKRLGFLPAGSVLVAVSRRDEINDYIRRAGLAESDFAVLVAADSQMNDRGRQDRDEARILFTTHAMIFSRAPGQPFAEQDCFHFRGQPRALRLWDESLLPARPVTVQLDPLHGLLEPLRPVAPGAAMALDGLILDAMGREPGQAIAVPPTLILPSAGRKTLSEPQEGHWDHLATLAGSTALIHVSNRYGRELVAAVDCLPTDFAPAIILDASGRVRHTYRVWEKHGGNLDRLASAANDYSLLTVHHWDRTASRSALSDPETRQDILQAVADLINDHPKKEWLVIHRTAKEGVDVKAELKGLVDGEDRIRFLNWGAHHGTNLYREVRNVIVLGLWYHPEAAHAAQFLAASHGREVLEVTTEDRAAIEMGEHQHNLLQAVCRASVRNGSDGVCGDCMVYVIGKAGKDTKALIADTFPGAAVLDWRPVEPTLKGRALEVAEEIGRRFAAEGVYTVRKADIRQALRFRNSQDLSQVLKRPDVRSWLERQGMVIERRDIVRLAA